MNFIRKFLTFLLSYCVVVLGFFVFSIFADRNLKEKVAELMVLPTREIKKNQVEMGVAATAPVIHRLAPDSVRGIYITASTATISKFDKLLELVDKTELNTIVLDFKDWKGQPAFKLKRASLQEFTVSHPVIRDIDALVRKVHDKGIYLIGRIAVFQDPYLVAKKPEWALRDKRGGVWRDWKGISWVDPTHPDVWKYNVELAREAYSHGFDEINFDYVRFPSDGPIEQIKYATYDGKSDKSAQMRKFFAYLDHELRRNAVTQYTRDGVTRKEESVNMPISVDVFGLTMGREDGLGIGQRYQDVAPFFDAVSPMVYPSHYPPTYQGFANPAAHPYEIINDAMKWGVEKLAYYRGETSIDKSNYRGFASINSSGKPFGQLRPWLQDFDLGANYDAAMVRKEIQAVYDAGLDDWLLWNAGNNYTAGALEAVEAD
jgi:hypothetical protein